MNKTYLVALTSAALLGGFVVPAHASETLNCTTGGENTGTFTITGSTVEGFFDCAGTAAIPDYVTAIGNEAFNGAEYLTQATFDSGSQLTSIGAYAFAGTGLTSISIPNSVTELGTFSFALTTSLTSVGLNTASSLLTIRNNAFDRSALTSITVPATVTTIEAYAFANTSSLTSVTFAAGSALTSIGYEAFVDSGITSIEIPASVTSIGDNAFESTEDLETVTFGSGSTLSAIPAAMFHYSGLRSIALPSTITTIGASAFYNNTRLSSITLPSSLTAIGANAFGGTSSLTNVRFESLAAPTMGADVFLNSGPSATASIKYNATGFDLVSGLWNGLLVSRDTAPAPDQAPDPVPVTTPTPISTTPTPTIARSFTLDSPVLANQQKKVLRNLIRSVGDGASFEVVAGITREPGQTKKQAKALALAKASAIKKYLVARGAKPKSIVLKTKVYKQGVASETAVSGSSSAS